MAADPVPPGHLRRLAAFTDDPAGGNPAGVWIGDVLPPADEMQRIAAEVGYSETAFLKPDLERPGSGRYRVRYFSPLAEVAFCGHATIASGVALGPGDLVLRTNDGEVPVRVAPDAAGDLQATLTSIEPWVDDAPSDLLATALDLLAWRPDELDPTMPPAVAFAGVRHLVIGVAAVSTLERLAYPVAPMQALMLAHDLTTLQLVWRASATTFRARDPFPVGGVVEDPATGAAAAAFGAYLRERGLVTPPATIEILQGIEMGRPSRLIVGIDPGSGGIHVSGTAVAIPT